MMNANVSWYFNNYKSKIWPSYLGISFAVTEVLLFTEAWGKLFTNSFSQYERGFIPLAIGLLIQTILLFLVSAYPLYKRFFKSYPVAAILADADMQIQYAHGPLVTRNLQDIGKVDFQAGKSFFFFTKEPRFVFYDKQGKVFLQTEIMDAQKYEEIATYLQNHGLLGVTKSEVAEKTVTEGTAITSIDTTKTETEQETHHSRDILIGLVGGASFLYALPCLEIFLKLIIKDFDYDYVFWFVLVLEALVGWLTAYFTKGQVKWAMSTGITVISICSILAVIYAALTATVLIWGIAILMAIIYGCSVLGLYVAWTYFWGNRRRKQVAIREVMKESTKVHS